MSLTSPHLLHPPLSSTTTLRRLSTLNPSSTVSLTPLCRTNLPKLRCGAALSSLPPSPGREGTVGDGFVMLRETEDLGDAYQKTLMLVECSMLASVAGLAYFLSNSLNIEVATAMLLLVLSGPVKASTYLLMHGLVGLAMGSLWRLGIGWGFSITLCTIVRAMGAIGYVLLSSFLIRENILNLITINVHASLSYILVSIGVNTIPSMDIIYAIFGSLLLFNCGFFVFLLHILYAVFLTKLGMKANLTLPVWLEKAI